MYLFHCQGQNRRTREKMMPSLLLDLESVIYSATGFRISNRVKVTIDTV